jgi:hypothetical protein
LKASLNKLLGGVLKGKEGNFWHPADQVYPRLMGFDGHAAGLTGRAGLYAVWHLGVRPQWLRVSATRDLGAACDELKRAAWIATHEANAGIFIAWASPTSDGSAMALFLSDTLKPAYQDEVLVSDVADRDVAPVICPLPPGTRKD